MKAAVCHEFGKPLSIKDVHIDEPRRKEVKVKLSVCAICHSDVHYVDGAWGGTLPAIYGHEAAGIVESVGLGVSNVNKSDHVIVSLLKSCGVCFFCRHGQTNQCSGHFETNEPGRLSNAEHNSIIRGLGTACFAEYAVVHESQVSAIPKDMDFSAAALLACGVITGYGAVTNSARVEPGSHVVVIGIGGVGVNSIQAAKISNSASVIAVDISDDRLQFAALHGATHTVNSSNSDPLPMILEITENRGADYVFVTAGIPQVINESFTLIRRGGTVVLVGMPPVGSNASFEAINFIDANQRILGCKMGESNLTTDIPMLLSLYHSGELKLDELVTKRYKFADINDALNDTRRGIGLRNVVVFD